MKFTPLLLLGTTIATIATDQVWAASEATTALRVSENRRWLEYADERPFFWMGDTAWELFHRPRGEPFTVRMDVIRSSSVQSTWFDPRYGTAYSIYRGGNEGMQTFTPPTSGRGQDWVLVLDDATRNFPLPGQQKE